jgi:hypothetical protein
MKDNTIDAKDQIKWKWLKGAATTTADFGNPTTTNDYFLCIYDNGSRISAMELPAGGTCAGKPCWKSKSTGFTYKDKDLTPDGVLSATLKSGADQKAVIKVTAKGVNVPEPLLSSITGPVVVQFQRGDGGICFGAQYSAPFKKSDGATFIDKAD